MLNMPEQAGSTRKQVQESESKARCPREGVAIYVLLESEFRSGVLIDESNLLHESFCINEAVKE